jgi:hypothetical protein
MVPGSDKRHLVETLDHFGVNRVEYYSLRNLSALCHRFLPTKRFGLRSITKPGAKFYYAVGLIEVIGMVQDGEVDPNQYIACDSLKEEDATTLVMNGEVMVTPDNYYTNGIERPSGTTVRLYNYSGLLNYKQGQSCREIHRSSSKVVQRWRDVPGCLLDLIWSKELLGYVIEFSLYREPVGIQNDVLLIWEIRRY